jgi:hypothetical protein
MEVLVDRIDGRGRDAQDRRDEQVDAACAHLLVDDPYKWNGEGDEAVLESARVAQASSATLRVQMTST